MLCLSFRRFKQLWLLAVCAPSQAHPSSILPNCSLIMNGSCHRSLSIWRRINEAFITVTPLIQRIRVQVLGDLLHLYSFIRRTANLNTAIVQCHQWQTEKSITVTPGEGGWRSTPHLPVRPPADGSAASERVASRNGVKMVQDASCLKITTAALDLGRITGGVSPAPCRRPVYTNMTRSSMWGVQTGDPKRCALTKWVLYWRGVESSY